MDSTPAVMPLKYRRFLPYWAVLQTDLKQTLQSWVYRLWVIVSVLAVLGYLLYRYGVYREAGMVESASLHAAQLFRGLLLGSLALIVVLTVSSIASERGTLADSILSRGISRHQYFMAKWHSRLLVVLVTFSLLATFMLLGSYFLLSEDLTFSGGLIAVLMVGALILAIVSWGVTIGALTSSTVMGITLFWIVLYGVGFLLSLLPNTYPSPERTLSRLPHMLRGDYNVTSVTEWIGIGVLISVIGAMVGLFGFQRKDV